MGIYEMKAECLECLRKVCNYEYTGMFKDALKALQAECETLRWGRESSMETVAGLEQWVSALDTAWTAFKNESKPVRGRDGSVMPEHPDDQKLRAFVDAQISESKTKTVEMQKYKRPALTHSVVDEVDPNQKVDFLLNALLETCL